MAKIIVTECPVCSGEVRSYPSYRRKFCGSACYNEAQRRGTVRVGRDILARNRMSCAHCGKAVRYRGRKKRDGERADHCFCDRRCYDSYRRAIIAARRVPCARCGKPADTLGKHKIRFCSDECRRLGRRPTSCTCNVCGVAFTPIRIRQGHITRLRRTICSPECKAQFYRTDAERKRKISAAFTRDKHPNWQGGSHRAGFRGHEWQQIADEVRKRAGYRCEHCGLSQEAHLRRWRMRLNVNHKDPFHQSRSKVSANRISNLEALCKPCHTKADWKWRKSHPVQYSMVWK